MILSELTTDQILADLATDENLTLDEDPVSSAEDICWDEIRWSRHGGPFLTVNDREYQVVDFYGGVGQGDSLWVVFSVTDGTNTRYFRVDGFYASYVGTSWEGAEIQEVQPQERVVTVWE